MKRRSIITASLVTLSVVGATGIGVASAATTKTSSTDSMQTTAKNMTGNVGSSTIPRSVFQQARLDAEAQVLNTTTANIQAAHKNHSFKQLLQQANLTPKTFGQKVKAQITSELEAKGYSQDEITIALERKQIVRLHHKLHHAKKEAAN